MPSRLNSSVDTYVPLALAEYRDRLGLQECLLEGRDGADVGLRRPLPHGDPDHRTRKLYTAARNDVTALDQWLECGLDDDDHVNGLTAIESHRDRILCATHRRPEGRNDLVVRRLLELLDELLIRLGECTGGHHLDLVRARGRRDQ